jgi:hypothetical protein
MINFSAYTSIASIFWNEIVVNGLFSADTGWLGLSANNWSIAGGKAVFSGASASDKALYRPTPIRLGTSYRITFEVTDAGATPSFKLAASDGSSIFNGDLSDYANYPIGSYVFDVLCTKESSNIYIIGDNTAGSFSLTSFSVKEKIFPTPYVVLTYHTSCCILGSVMYGISGQFLEKSIDFGDTWIRIDHEFTGTMQSCFISKDGILFVNCGTDGSGTDIWRSPDNGANWAKVLTTNSGLIRVPWNFAQASNGTIFIGEYTLGADTPYLWKSINNGVDWTRIDDFIGGGTQHLHQVFVDPETQRLYVTTGETKKTYYSDDEGTTWHEIFAAYGLTGWVSITSIPGSRFFGSDYTSADANAIYKSTNDSTLTIALKPPESYDVEWGEVISVNGTTILFAMFINSNNAAYDTLLAKSNDGGVTWKIIKVIYKDMWNFMFPASDYRHRIPSEFSYLIVQAQPGLIRIKV